MMNCMQPCVIELIPVFVDDTRILADTKEDATAAFNELAEIYPIKAPFNRHISLMNS